MIRPTSTSFLGALALMAFAAPPSVADVLIVDATGAGDFADLQAAVDAAADGDLVLVRTGAYSGCTIDDRSISIVADAGAVVQIEGTLDIANLALGRDVLIADLSVTGAPGLTPQPALTVTLSRGALRFQDCTFTGGLGGGECFVPVDGAVGASVTSSIPVVFSRCSIVGGGGFGDDDPLLYSCIGGTGGTGLTSSGSSLALYECEVRGGAGGIAASTGGNGGDALQILDFGLFAAGTSITGGRGGDAFDFIFAFAGDGGDGLVVSGPAVALLSDSSTAGGAGGIALVFPANNGAPGAATSGAGTISNTRGPLRRLESPVLVRDGGFVSMTVHGVAGDRVYLPTNARPGFVYRPDFEGVWLLRYPTMMPVAPLGVIDGSGSLTLQVPVAMLSGSELSRLRYLQVYVIDATDQPFLGTPAHLVSLNCGTLSTDCNGNALFDSCDLLAGTSLDCDLNGVPDECQTDCNNNSIPDACDLADGAPDVNQNGIPDECEPANQTYHVDVSAAPGGDGSPGSPFQSLSGAFARALTGDTILVADGTYTGPSNRNLSFDGRDLVVASENGATACIIDCEDAGRAFSLRNQETAASRIRGFTIVNGNSFGGTDGNLAEGGGIRMWNAHAIVEDCTIAYCTASFGGGVSFSSSDGRLVNCRVGRNTATSNGGGIRCSSNHPVIDRCLIGENFASNVGGGIAGHVAFVRHCTLIDNEAGNRGGGVYGAGHLDHCLVIGNRAATGGGIAGGGPSEIDSCTVAHNVATVQGGGLNKEFGTAVSVRNGIFWGNTAPTGAQIAVPDGTFMITVTVTRCAVEGGQAAVFIDPDNTLVWGAGNVTTTPGFVDIDGPDNDPLTTGDNDYHLAGGSPCIDAGDNSLVRNDYADVDADGNTAEPVPLDLDLLPRFVDDPAAPDVGVGSGGIVDMGVFERQP